MRNGSLKSTFHWVKMVGVTTEALKFLDSAEKKDKSEFRGFISKKDSKYISQKKK